MGSKSDLLLDLYDNFCEPYWLSKSAMKEFVEKSSIQDSKSKIWQIRGNYNSFSLRMTMGTGSVSVP